ncbi:uncharacterized protein LOC128018749 isoform X1 [Carassius gibelio]|uniref:uncharacterized protein LOC128018749 isoform X1 n=1 Tax=Carassius gibelio TaxID=101364 RepID=UPI002277D55D|nr:uncharacterized protein LOC128018749 isoform X1 [Carassius gibelio]
MYNSCGVLFLLFGFTMLESITCYSDGSLLESQCQGMNFQHSGLPAQNTEAPFKIEPEYIEVTDSLWGRNITVSLSANPTQFRGFMLDARACDTCKSAGKFNLINLQDSELICNGRVVAHNNNQKKTAVQVLWTPEETGLFFFRAAFVEIFGRFWLRKAIILTTTAPPSTESTSHSTQTSPIGMLQTQTVSPTSEATNIQKNQTASPTILTTASTIESYCTDMSQTQTASRTSEATSTQKNPTASPTIFTNADSYVTVAPASPPQCAQYTRFALALLLFSRLCFLGGSSLLMIIRPVSKMATMIASVFEPASKIIAVIFILIKLIKYECVFECDRLQTVFTALTVAAMVSSLLHTLTVFLHCGPSHELRRCWLCSIITIGLMNSIITTTAIFFEIWRFEELWVPSLMGVFVIWEFMLYLGSVYFEQMGKYQSRKNQNRILEKRKSPWFFMFIIFSVFNAMYTTALITGVSLVKMKNC